VPMISRLLDVLERDPEFRSFTFDGQTIPIQDHLEKRPEDRPRIEALVRADRLLIGPWHVLADLLLVSGESIIRNLQEGLRVSGGVSGERHARWSTASPRTRTAMRSSSWWATITSGHTRGCPKRGVRCIARFRTSRRASPASRSTPRRCRPAAMS